MNAEKILGEIEDIFVTDYVANGSFQSLKENVNAVKDGPAIMIRLVDFNNSWRGPFKYVDEDSYNFLAKSSLKKGELIISNVGANIGTVFRAPDLDKKMTLGPNAVVLKIKENSQVVNNDFLYYFFSSSKGQHLLKSISGGSAQPKFNKTDLRKLSLELPNLGYQEFFSSILVSIDEKIELNQKMNETLQELAKTLFKSWFIDFDPVRAKAENRSTGLSKEISDLFPNSFQESELGDIPKNWKVTNLDDVTSKFTTGLNPRKNFVLGSGENFYVTIKNLGDFEIVLNDKCDKVNSEAIKKINNRSNLNKDDILFSGIGTIGKVVYVFDEPKNWDISESVFSMRANPEVTYPSFLYQLLKSYPLQGYVKAHAEGSVQKGIRMGSLKMYKFSLSNFKVQNKFNEIISPMINKISINLKEIKNLVATRDILLPKLISRELRIPDAEKTVQENSV